MVMTPGGAGIRRLRRAAGPRRGLVIVSRELYCDGGEVAWPAEDDRPPLEGRYRGREYLASVSLMEALPDDLSRRRPALVPEDVVRDTRGRRRWARLRRAAFGVPRRGRHLRRSLLLAACAALAATGYAVSAAAELSGAAGSREPLSDLESTLDSLRDQRRAIVERMAGLPDGASSAGPTGGGTAAVGEVTAAVGEVTATVGEVTATVGEVAAAIGAVGAGDRVRSLSVAGDRLTVVVESRGGVDVRRRFDAIAGFRVESTETRYVDGEATVTVRALLDAEDGRR